MSGCYLADFQVEAALSIEGERQAMSYSSIDTRACRQLSQMTQAAM